MLNPALKGPFKPRKASKQLRKQLLADLRDGKYDVGEPFFTDASLMRTTGLSRKTVRKVLGSLQREGWIERLPGKGSYVGPRVATGLHGVVDDPGRADGRLSQTVRLAAVVHLMGVRKPDWYTLGVLAGLEMAASEAGLIIELMGNIYAGVKLLADRLSQTRPDVMVVMPVMTRHAFLIAEAERLDIPCVLVGTTMQDLELPSVCEDGEQGAALAVEHLVKNGHERIGLLLTEASAPWSFQRRRGFLRAMRAAGLDVDERHVLWTPDPVGPSEENIYEDLVMDFVQSLELTAVVAGPSNLQSPTLDALTSKGRLRIPQDLSVVFFDQSHTEYRRYLGVTPTIVELPLPEMGRHIAAISKQIRDGESPPERTVLPCRLKQGGSVVNLRTCQADT